MTVREPSTAPHPVPGTPLFPPPLRSRTPPRKPWMEGNWFQPTALVAPPCYTASAVLLVLAVCADAVAFWSVVARVLQVDRYQTTAFVVGLTAMAVGMSGEIGRGQRRRKASDPNRSNGLLWLCVAGWLGLGAVSTVARIFYGPQPAFGETDVAAVAAEHPPEVLAGLFFAVLYFTSGIFSIMAVYRAYNPAVPVYWKARTELDAADAQLRAAIEADERARRDAQIVANELARALHLRKVARVTTRNETTTLQLRARQRMAAMIEDDDGHAIAFFMDGAPEIEDLPTEDPTVKDPSDEDPGE